MAADAVVLTGSGASIGERIVSVSGEGTRVAFVQWQKDRSMVYVHEVRTGVQRPSIESSRHRGVAEGSLRGGGQGYS